MATIPRDRLHGALDLGLDIPSFNILEKAGYTVVILKITKPQDIGHAVSQAKASHNKIHALWIRVHGEPTHLLLHENKRDPSNSVYLQEKDLPSLNPAFQELEAEASIILGGCHVNKPLGEGRRNITEAFAYWSGKKVYGSPRLLRLGNIEIEATHPLRVNFRKNAFLHAFAVFLHFN